MSIKKEQRLPSYYNNNLNNLTDQFKTEFNLYSNYIKGDVSDAKKRYNELIKQLSLIDFKAAAVELSPTNAVVITIMLRDEKAVMITRPFYDLPDLKSDEVIFTIFVNRKRILSDAKRLPELVEGLNEYNSL